MYEAVRIGLMSLYSAFSMMMPAMQHVPLAMLINAGRKIADSGIDLKFRIKILDYKAFSEMIEEIGEAATLRTEQEQQEAMYALLGWCTNIEEHKPCEEFMALLAA